jgi:hypothetical protein
MTRVDTSGIWAIKKNFYAAHIRTDSSQELLCSAKKISVMYSFSGNSAA